MAASSRGPVGGTGHRHTSFDIPRLVTVYPDRAGVALVNRRHGSTTGEEGRGDIRRKNREGAGDTVHAGTTSKRTHGWKSSFPADGGLPQRHQADERTVIENR